MREKELENYICNHPECMPGPFEVLGRQVKTPHGIIDILGIENGQIINVIELKLGYLTEADIGQVLRYTYDIKNTIAQVGRLNYQSVPPEYMDRFCEMFCMLPDSPTVQPVLIGKGAKQKILAAADCAGIYCMSWQIVSGKLEINYLYDMAPEQILFPSFNTHRWVQRVILTTYQNFIASLNGRQREANMHENAITMEDIAWLEMP